MELFHQLEFRMIFDFSIKTVLWGWNNFGRNELCFFRNAEYNMPVWQTVSLPDQARPGTSA